VSITKVVVLLTRNLAKLSVQFLNFLRFPRDITSFSKCVILLKLPFCTDDPTKNWNLLNMPLVYGKHSRKTRWLEMPPLAVGAARLSRFRRGRRFSWPCRDAWRRACSPRGRWCLEFGRGGTLRRRTTGTAAVAVTPASATHGVNHKWC
jgi:hypothetical protein